MSAAMDTDEMLYDVFEALYNTWVKDVEAPERFVGLQDGKVVVLQPNGTHFAVVVLPAEVGVANGTHFAVVVLPAEVGVAS